MPSSLAKFFVVAVAVLLAVTAVTVGVRIILPPTSVNSQFSPQLATVAFSSFEDTVNETGTVVPATETDLNFAIPGTVASIPVKMGQKVSAGMVLANLQSSSAASAVSQAEANLASAQATLSSAESPLTPAQSTSLDTVLSNAEQVQNQTIASVQETASIDAENIQSDEATLQAVQSEFNAANCSASSNSSSSLCQSYTTQIDQDQRQLTIDQERSQSDASAGALRESEAQGQVNAAQAALNAASTPNPSQVAEAQAKVNAANSALDVSQAHLAQYTLTAPVGGVVLAINGQVGENVTGAPTTSQTLPGTSTPLSAIVANLGGNQEPFIVIGQPSKLVVGFSFPSQITSQISVGRPVTVTGQGFAQLNLSGRVAAVSASPVTVASVPSYFATATLHSAKGLSWGMSVAVSVLVSRVTSVLAVPASAVFTVGGVPKVEVWNGKSGVETDVTLGAQGLTMVQITSGLQKGQQVELAANQGFTQAGIS